MKLKLTSFVGCHVSWHRTYHLYRCYMCDACVSVNFLPHFQCFLGSIQNSSFHVFTMKVLLVLTHEVRSSSEAWKKLFSANTAKWVSKKFDISHVDFLPFSLYLCVDSFQQLCKLWLEPKFNFVCNNVNVNFKECIYTLYWLPFYHVVLLGLIFLLLSLVARLFFLTG